MKFILRNAFSVKFYLWFSFFCRIAAYLVTTESSGRLAVFKWDSTNMFTLQMVRTDDKPVYFEKNSDIVNFAAFGSRFSQWTALSLEILCSPDNSICCDVADP